MPDQSSPSSEDRAFEAFMDGEVSFVADDAGVDYCTVEHTWVDAGGGMLICAVCEAERFSDEWGR